ncbi:MAG: M28 family peptidase [Melioribacteraceae bacterium]|nr:M28 family peptidase [Melioribacteraceae bacterium]MCF8353323.1 M28 family peptidase [Melioribacteraceae bacterium]MCF8393187.1 M28 family peptidase [Melioribacteraceae bacterium]MCF8419049.1 M28 family peptidase [Melioribacteraceae bacterium]
MKITRPIYILLIAVNVLIAQAPNNLPDALMSISGQAIKRHLDFLGSDLFEGRGTGTTGGNLAAKYLAQELNKIGLEPVGSGGTYYQHIPMHGSTALNSSKLEVFTEGTSVVLELWSDYLLFKSGDQTFTPNPIPLVFVGYGINAPEFDYNDYQSIDAEGKIVVFLDGEPISDNDDYFNGAAPSIHSSPEAKQRTALSRGARGSILIPELKNDGNSDWQNLIREFKFENVTLAYSATGSLSLLINPKAAEKIFQKSGKSYSDILSMHDEMRMTSFDLSSSISFKGEFKRRDFIAPNVVGMIEGSDPELRNTYVLISAHYDHLGIGPAVKGDSIYNGVFDNAVGAAGLLEIARVVNSLDVKPKRSIVFLLLTGEEKGLLGSQYYVDHPIFPLYKTVANINVDGVALWDNFKSIVALGENYSTIQSFVYETADKFDLDVVPIPEQFMQLESFSRSDQISFANAGIPSVLIYEGPDYVNMTYQEGIEKLIFYSDSIYHTPFDDLNQHLNLEAAVQHLQIILDVAYSIADSETEPEWKPGSPFINARLRSIAERR